MNLQSDDETGNAETTVSPKMIADYLRAHPGFFESFPDVLRDIEIKHSAGDAVSLLERQVSTLRDDNSRMKVRFEQLVALAKSNENLIKRIHQLALALMEAAGPEAIFATLSGRLAQEFDADRVRTVVFASPAFVDSSEVPEFVGTKWSAKALFSDVITAKSPKCGKLTQAQIAGLFPNDDEAIRSAAVLPLSGKSWDGLLIITSRDAERFHHDMGTDFLAYLGDIVSLVVDPWVAREVSG